MAKEKTVQKNNKLATRSKKNELAMIFGTTKIEEINITFLRDNFRAAAIDRSTSDLHYQMASVRRDLNTAERTVQELQMQLEELEQICRERQ